MVCPGIVRDFAYSTTIHGLRDIVDTKSIPKKVILSGILSVFVGYFAYAMVLVFVEYQKFPVVSRIGIEFADEFPTVTICPHHWRTLRR